MLEASESVQLTTYVVTCQNVRLESSNSCISWADCCVMELVLLMVHPDAMCVVSELPEWVPCGPEWVSCGP